MRRITTVRDMLTRSAVVAAFWVVLASALAKEKASAASSLVWPPAPAPARISFVQSIRQPADLGLKASGWSRFSSWLLGTEKGRDELVKPFGIALDDNDNLCFTDTGANVVGFHDAAKKKWLRWDRVGKIRFASPVAVAKRGDVLFVADAALASVIAFDTGGKLRFELKDGLERPVGLTIAGDKLFVVDSPANRIVVFDLRGNRLTQFGQRGAGEGEFNFPTHIATDSRGGLLVTDSLNGRVQLFDANGRYEGRLGSTGDSPGHFGRAKGVAEDSFQHVYVLDAMFDTLQVFDRSGRILLSLGEAGADPGQFWLPNGIAISRDNRIFIADSYNRRIQVLKYVGK